MHFDTVCRMRQLSDSYTCEEILGADGKQYPARRAPVEPDVVTPVSFPARVAASGVISVFRRTFLYTRIHAGRGGAF